MSNAGNEILLSLRTEFSSQRVVETLRKVSGIKQAIYYWPSLDMRERLAVSRHVKIGMDGTQVVSDLIESQLAHVLHRSRDAFGNRLFADDQEDAIRQIDPDVISQIANEMTLGPRVTYEDAEKN